MNIVPGLLAATARARYRGAEDASQAGGGAAESC